MLYKDILAWSEKGLTIDSLYPNDDWSPLQFSAAVGNLDALRVLISEGADVNYQSKSRAIPQLTALMIAVRAGHMDIVQQLVPHSDVNLQDQYGFTAIHYATISRQREILTYLISNGGIVTVASKTGTSALDMARELKFDEIADILLSKTNLESDPTLPKFRDWLLSLGAAEYLPKFLEAGFDLPYISSKGLSHEDLDAVGIPALEKRGLRRKLIDLWELGKYFTGEEEDEEDGDDEEDDEDEDDEDEDDDDD